jgi:hypothetical protein
MTLNRVGAVGGIAGAFLAIIGNLLHPPLPTDAIAAHTIIAQQRYWDVVHLIIILAAVCLAVFFVALAAESATPHGRAWSWTGATVGLLGAAVLIVGIGIDGYAGKALANMYQAARDNERFVHLHVAEGISLLHTGLLYVWLMLFFGVPFVAYGLGGLAEGWWKPWISWLAIGVGGIVAVVSAVAYIAPSEEITRLLGMLALVTTLWVILVARWLGTKRRA